MSNILFLRIAIRRFIRKRILLIKDDFNFYFRIIDEFLDNRFININNKRYLILTRNNLIRAQNNKKHYNYKRKIF